MFVFKDATIRRRRT